MHKVLLFPRFTSAEWDDAYAQGKIKALWNTTLDRNAVVEAHSGTLIVNGGTFYAKSSADAFQIDDPYYDDNEAATDATIKQAKIVFHKNGNDTNFIHDLTQPDYAHESSFGEPGIPERAIDREQITFELDANVPKTILIRYGDPNEGKDPLLDWKDLQLFEDIELNLIPKRGEIEGVTYNDGLGDVELSGGVLWDGENDTALSVPTHTYFEAPYYQKDVTPLRSPDPHARLCLQRQSRLRVKNHDLRQRRQLHRQREIYHTDRDPRDPQDIRRIFERSGDDPAHRPAAERRCRTGRFC